MSAFEDVVEAWGFKITGDKPLVLSPAGIAPDGSIVYSDAESFRDLIGAEPELGNPSVNGWILSSSSAGVRSWVAPNAHSHAIADVTGLQTALDARMVTASYPDLVAIEALAGTSGLLRKTAANTWALDTSAYLTTAGTAAAATKLATGRTIGITGDATWTSPTFDGTANVTAAITLASIITAAGPIGSGTMVPVITYDAKGRVTEVTTAAITPAGIGAATSSHNHTLDSLSNTTITTIAAGEILKWNGTAWVNNTLAEAGIQPAGSYLTGNQTITLSGIVTGSGATAITTSISDAALSIAKTSGLQAALDGKVSIALSRVTQGTYVSSSDDANSLATRHANGVHFGHWYNIAEAPKTGYFNFLMLPETKTGNIHNTLAFSNAGAIEGYIGRGNDSSAETWRRIWTDGDFSATDIAAWNAKQDALGYVPVNKAGDAMTNSLSTTGRFAARTELACVRALGTTRDTAPRWSLLNNDEGYGASGWVDSGNNLRIAFLMGAGVWTDRYIFSNNGTMKAPAFSSSNYRPAIFGTDGSLFTEDKYGMMVRSSGGYIAVQNAARLAGEHYEFWDPVGWADIHCGTIKLNSLTASTIPVIDANKKLASQDYATFRTTIGAANDTVTNMGYSLEGTDPFANRNAHGPQGGVRTWLGIGPFSATSQWHNVVDVRHLNGTGGGATAYGGQLVWGFPSTPRLAFRATGDTWTEVWTNGNLINPVTGTGVSGRVAYWSGTGKQTSSANLTFDGLSLTLSNLSSSYRVNDQFGLPSVLVGDNQINLRKSIDSTALPWSRIRCSSSSSGSWNTIEIDSPNASDGRCSLSVTGLISSNQGFAFGSASLFNVNGSSGASIPKGMPVGTMIVFSGQLNIQADTIEIPSGQAVWYRSQAGASSRIVGPATLSVNRQTLTLVKYPNEWRISGLYYV